MFHSRIKGRLCRSCINEHFTKMTAMTTFLGWWGMISFILTPFLLLNNVIRYLFCLGLKPAPRAPATGTASAILVLVVAGMALAVVAATLVVGVVRH